MSFKCVFGLHEWKALRSPSVNSSQYRYCPRCEKVQIKLLKLSQPHIKVPYSVLNRWKNIDSL